MSVKGLFSSDAGMPGDRIVPGGLAGALVQLSAVNVAPLLVATGAQTYRSFRSTEYKWTEESQTRSINYIVSNNGEPNGARLTFANTSWITVGMMFLVSSTAEYLLVRSVSGNVVTVQRGFGNNNVRPIIPTATTDIVVQRIGTAFEEGSQRPAAVANTPGIPRFNYTQIFRNTWAITRTAKMMEYRLGDLKMRLKRDCAVFHASDIEMSMLYGIRSIGVKNNQPHRTMDGLYQQISTNIGSAADGILTKPMLDTFLEVIFSHQIRGKGNSRIALCGQGFITLLNRLVEQSTQHSMSPTQSVFGINVTTWQTPHGSITLIPTDFITSAPGRRNDLIVLHPDSVEAYYVYEGESDCDTQCKNGGVDGDIGGLISELTFILKGELTAGILTGICDVAPEPQRMMIVQPHNAAINPGC